MTRNLFASFLLTMAPTLVLACGAQREAPVYDNENCQLRLSISDTLENIAGENRDSNQGLAIVGQTNYHVGDLESRFSTMDDDGVITLTALYNLWAQAGILSRNERSSGVPARQARLLRTALNLYEQTNNRRITRSAADVAAAQAQLGDKRASLARLTPLLEQMNNAIALNPQNSELIAARVELQRDWGDANSSVNELEQQITTRTETKEFAEAQAPRIADLKNLLPPNLTDPLPAQFFTSLGAVLSIATQTGAHGYGIGFGEGAVPGARSRGRAARLCDDRNLSSLRCGPLIANGLGSTFCARDFANGAPRIIPGRRICPNGNTIELLEGAPAAPRPTPGASSEG